MKPVSTKTNFIIFALSLILIFSGCENPFQSDRKGEYKIAYDIRSSTQTEVYLMNSDGSDVIQLTSRPSDIDEDDYYWSDSPVWSANGDKLAIRSNRGDKVEVFSIKPDGSGLKQLTDLPKNANIRDMAWSPKQEMIALASDSGVYIVEENGMNQMRISNERSSDVSWNKKRSEIVYDVSKINDDSTSYIGEIHIATADGEMLHRIAEPSVSIRFSEWSSDDESITYVKGGWWGDGGIYEYDLATQEEKEIVSEFNITGISLSPKGNKIAFLHYVTLYVHDVYVADIDGENLNKINPEHIAVDGCGSISWSPDGESIMVECGYNTDKHPDAYGIYKVKPDGSEWSFLGKGDNPSWSPVRIH